MKEGFYQSWKSLRILKLYHIPWEKVVNSGGSEMCQYYLFFHFLSWVVSRVLKSLPFSAWNIINSAIENNMKKHADFLKIGEFYTNLEKWELFAFKYWLFTCICDLTLDFETFVNNVLVQCTLSKHLPRVATKWLDHYCLWIQICSFLTRVSSLSNHIALHSSVSLTTDWLNWYIFEHRLWWVISVCYIDSVHVCVHNMYCPHKRSLSSLVVKGIWQWRKTNGYWQSTGMAPGQVQGTGPAHWKQWILVSFPVSDQCEHFGATYQYPLLPVPFPVPVIFPFPCVVNLP